jgi:uncharacterized delta-60 repeat protein
MARLEHEGYFRVTFAGAVVYAVKVQPDGKIVAIGSRFDSSTGTSGDMLIVRLTSNGAYDSSFNLNGWVFADFNLGSEEGRTLAFQPDGKIIIAGHSLIGGAFSRLRDRASQLGRHIRYGFRKRVARS